MGRTHARNQKIHLAKRAKSQPVFLKHAEIGVNLSTQFWTNSSLSSLNLKSLKTLQTKSDFTLSARLANVAMLSFYIGPIYENSSDVLMNFLTGQGPLHVPAHSSGGGECQRLVVRPQQEVLSPCGQRGALTLHLHW